MKFRVRAKDTAGVTRMLTREAETREELLSALRTEKLLVLSVDEVKTERFLPPWWSPKWLKPMTGFHVELGLRELASMLRSGVALIAAVKTMSEQALSPWATLVWMRVGEKIFRGGSFAEALAAQPKRFSELVVRLAEVGERSGELERAVSRAADQLESRRMLRSQVVNALVYPFLAVTMAVGVSAFLVVSVIPKLAAFLAAGGEELPAMTRMLVDFSGWVRAHGLFILLYLAAFTAAWIVIRFHDKGRELEDALLLRVPVTGNILRLSGSALFARAMQIMTESGVTLLDALATAAQLLANRRLRLRIVGAREAILKGRSLGDALEPAKEFTPMLRRMASVGEVTGSMPEAFAEAARFHEMMLALAVKRFGMLIEPVLIIVTGLIVGFVYIAFFLAIFAIAGTA